MNIVTLSGRICKDAQKSKSGKMAFSTLAVDRALKDQNGNKVTDFHNLKWIGEKKSDFAEKYVKKGLKLIITGEIQNDSYEKDGVRNTITQILVNGIEFCESKATQQQTVNNTATTDVPTAPTNNGMTDFMSIPDGMAEELPFN